MSVATEETWKSTLASRLRVAWLCLGAGCLMSVSSGEELVLHGWMQSRSTFTGTLGVGEHLVAVHCKQGQEVREGAVLYEIANPDLVNEMANLAERLEKIDRRELSRLELTDRLAVLEQRLQRKKNQLDSSRAAKLLPPPGTVEEMVQALEEARLEQSRVTRELEFVADRMGEGKSVRALLKQQLEAVRQEVAKLQVKAPFDGIVEMDPQRVGRLRPGDEILRLWSCGELVVKAELWGLQRHLVSVGKGVSVSGGRDAKVQTEGHVISVSGLPEYKGDGFPVFTVFISLVAVPENLKIGDSVNVMIKGEAQPVLPPRR